MVNTIKFSQFSTADLSNSTNKMVGYGGGINIQSRTPPAWTTAMRPTMPYDGLLGYNTDVHQYEYYDDEVGDWVQLEASSQGNLNWDVITGTSAQMVSGNGYVSNNAGQVVMTLPLVCEIGQLVAAKGYGIGGWAIVFNTGQNAVIGNMVATTTTGSISSTTSSDYLVLLCVVANQTFISLDMAGNLTVT